MNVSIKLSKAKLAELLGEFLGTFFFMFVLFISPVAIRSEEPLLIGFLYMALFFVFIGLCKVQFNPIFSFGDFMLSVYEGVKTRDFSKIKDEAIKFGSLVGVQFLAALIAFALAYRLRDVLSNFQLVAAGYGGNTDAMTQLQSTTVWGTKFDPPFQTVAFVLEMFFSMVLVLMYQMTMNSTRKHMTAFVIGVALFCFMVLIKDLDGASFNPIRSLIPAIFLGGQYLSTLWVYIVAPLVGALLGSFGYYFLTWLKPEIKKA